MAVSLTDGDGRGITLRGAARRELAALLVVAVTFTVTGGLSGALAGLALAGAAVVGPPVVVFGLGQALLLVVLAEPSLVQLAVSELALLGLLLATPAMTGRTALATTLLFGAVGTLLWLGVDLLDRTAAAALFVGGVVLIMYLCHRYERVVLGLAGGETA